MQAPYLVLQVILPLGPYLFDAPPFLEGGVIDDSSKHYKHHHDVVVIVAMSEAPCLRLASGHPYMTIPSSNSFVSTPNLAA